MGKKEEKMIYYLILLMPFIDIASSIATWNNTFSIGLLIKGFLLVYAGLFLLKNKKDYWKFFLIVSLYSLVSLGINIYFGNSLIGEITNLIKIFYLPTLILFFTNSKISTITPKTVTILSTIYLLLYLLPYPFHLGHNISEIYPNKDLYLSFFYVGNELANVFILLLPITFKYLMNLKKKRYIIIFSILTLCMLVLLGTKTMYISVILILLFFLYSNKDKIVPWLKKQWKFLIPIVFIIGLLSIYILPKTSFYQNIKTSLEFYEIDSVTDFLTIENIDNIIYSNRLDFLANVHQEFQRSPFIQKMFGIGRSKILAIKDIEIDIFDIFYSIGFIGLIVYIIYSLYAIRQKKLSSLYRFLAILLFIISFFSGHVLISPMVSTYIALLYGINEGGRTNEKLDKKSTKKNKNSLNA